jgi:hypothetical protein
MLLLLFFIICIFLRLIQTPVHPKPPDSLHLPLEHITITVLVLKQFIKIKLIAT